MWILGQLLEIVLFVGAVVLSLLVIGGILTALDNIAEWITTRALQAREVTRGWCQRKWQEWRQ